MKRNYEIAVVSRGGFARTVRIFGGKNSKTAVIVLDGASLFTGEHKFLFKKAAKLRTAIVGIDRTDGVGEFLPFAPENTAVTQKTACGAEAFSLYVTETLIPYLKKRFYIERFLLTGHLLSAATVLYIAGTQSDVSAFSMTDPPLFVSPVAFEEYLKRAAFRQAAYRVACTENPALLPDGVPRSVYAVGAVSIVAALTDRGIAHIELQTKTDAANLSESVSDFIDFDGKAQI